MTGVDWLDTVGAVVFAVVALVSAAQLAARWGEIDDRGGVALHAGMAAGMAAMSLPGPGPLSDTTWVVAFGLAAGWAGVSVGRRALAACRGPAAGRSWAPTGGAAHHLLASAVMVVTFGVGHGAHAHGVETEAVAAVRPIPEDHAAHGAAAHAAEAHGDHAGSGHADPAAEAHGDHAGSGGHADPAAEAHGDHAGSGGHADPADGGRADHTGHGHVATTAGVQLSPAVDDAIRGAAGWPVVWQLAALAFVAYGAWSVRGGQEAPACRHCAARVRPDDGAGRARRLARAAIGPGATRACAVVMAGGMAAMAFVL